MSETCAGFCVSPFLTLDSGLLRPVVCQFNFNFPQNDIAASRAFGAQGVRSPGTLVRIVDFHTGERKAPGLPGELQVRGPNVFIGYWNNLIATNRAFTSDGWFRTGDSAYLTPGPDCDVHGLHGDESRLLVVVGRDRDSLVVDGRKYALEDLLSHIQDLDEPGLDPLWVSAFPLDQTDATQGYVILYKPTYQPLDNRFQHGQTVLAVYKCVRLR